MTFETQNKTQQAKSSAGRVKVAHTIE